ncbi:F-type H+-transporting ATPase subunit gamma [Alkalibacterium subtropicum]|uniref:F-type H+-transporting ATPase subunit gamma n=1 Tax=Alkalibacterium subtropicum TaxID=753702 RepID=A0A1I1HKE5_9LACT|nr:FoF1 ATP synthase subunit gamma [Alkalibacterium subtropicum]SFC24609.1 F-type H+-transporting ATPase subunit gamma [Alkalibacterium subtropicum]
MQGLQGLKKSIDSAESLRAIVNTMKVHASVNINQFQHAAQASMEYRHILDMSLFIVLSEEEIVPSEEVEKGNILHVVFGSDHGLAGRVNERISLFALEHVSQDSGDIVIVIGQQIFQRLKNDVTIYKTFMQPQSTDTIYSMVNKLLVQIDELRDEMAVKKIVLYYNKPDSTSMFEENTELLFPIDLVELSKNQVQWESKVVPAYFAEKQAIISDLIREYFFITLYRAFCFSLASENASRLASMQSAEKNIENQLKELNDLYRRQRQTSITEELNDIISGFKALRE